MNDLSGLTGLERVQRYLRGETVADGLVAGLGFEGRAAEAGRVVFAARPERRHYNAGGSVHGGYTATLLDTVMGLASLTLLDARHACTTVELKVAYHRAITVETGPIEATGHVLSHGRRLIFAEARVMDAGDRLLASATSTLMVLERPA